MKKILLSLVLAITTFANAVAQNIPTDPSVRTGTLSNGMKYYIKKNVKPEKKVEFRLAINAGSINEDDDQKGLAHFMEHMNFNGTKNFPDNKLVDFLQSIGVKFGQHLNAYTSFDETVYMLPVPLDKPENLDSGLKVMEDWAFNALLTDKEINKERGVVLEELRLGLGPDKRMLDKYLPKVLYNSQYAQRLPIGDKTLLETFKPEVIRRFHRDWYRPNLMSIVVVGDINVDEVEAKIKNNFSNYTNPTNERKRMVYEVPNHKETFVSIESDPDASFSRVQLVYKDLGLPKVVNAEADYNQNIVENLFSTMLNGRLEELVNSATPPFTFGSTYHGGTWARTKEGFQSFAMTQEGKQLNALKVLMEETERAKRFGFTQAELDRAKAKVLSGLEKSYNNRDKTESDRLVDEYVRNFLEKEPIPGIEWEYNQYKKVLPTVTLSQVNEVVKNMVREENRVVVITGPKKENLTQATESQVLALFDQMKVADIKPYQEANAITSLVKPFRSKAKIKKTINDAQLGTTTWIFKNGAKVTYKKTDFKEDEIVFGARSLGGSSLVSDADFVQTQFAFPALAEAGFNGYSKSDITKYLAGKQASVNPTIGNLTEGMTGKSTKKDLSTLLEMVYGYFTNLNYDPASYNAYKEKQSAMYNNLTSNPQFYFSNEFSKFLNQKNPRFTNIVPMSEDWARTDYKKAYDIYKQRFSNAGDFHFYFVGNVDEAQLKQLATQYIGSLPSVKTKENFKDTGYRNITGDYQKTFKKGKDPKSMVVISYSGETPFDEKEKLALEALGEVATIKVIEKLREEEAGIYGGGAYGSMSKTPYGNYNFSIQFPCGPENADKLTKSALAELQKMIVNAPEQKDLDKFKEGEINDFKTQIKDNNFWLRNMMAYQVDGGDQYELLNYENKLRAITVSDLQNVAKKYLTKGKVIATLMPEDGWEKLIAKKSENNTVVSAPVSVATVTPQSVINNYINALGGKSKLEAIKTIKSKSIMKVMGMEIAATELKMVPNKTKRIQSVMGQESVQVFDGEKGYMMQGGQKMDMPEKMLPGLKKARLFDALSLNVADYKTVEKISENGADLYVLTGEKGKSYFDAKTGLLAKGTMEMGEYSVQEYMEVEGVKIPKKMILNMQGQNIEVITNEVIFNKEVAEADFK